MSHNHDHPKATGGADRRWLSAALAVILAFMAAEIIVGLLAHSLALITDAGHLTLDEMKAQEPQQPVKEAPRRSYDEAVPAEASGY